MIDQLLQELARERGAARLWLLKQPVRAVAASVAALGDSLQNISVLTAPPIAVEDVRALGAAARTAGRTLVADTTACGPRGCAAERLGAHVSLTGLDDGCCLVGVSRGGDRSLLGLRAMLDKLEAADAPDDELATRLIDEADRHWHAASDEAQVVASYLRCHPRITAVRYPGLKGDASFSVAARTLQGGFGPFVDYCVDGGSWRRLTCGGDDPHATVLRLEETLRPRGLA